MRVPLTRVYDDLDKIVEGLSSKARQITFGVLAFVWLFLAGGTSVPAVKLAASSGPLSAIAALCIGSLICDLLQTFFAFLATYKVMSDAEAANATDAEFDTTDWRRRLQDFLFYAKLALTAAGAGWLVVLLWGAFLA